MAKKEKDVLESMQFTGLNADDTLLQQTKKNVKNTKLLEIFYDLDYGIYIFKTNLVNLSKTKFNLLKRKLKGTIDDFLDKNEK